MKMTRKEAVKKMGFTAFTGATMMLLLNNPAKVETPDSPDIPKEKNAGYSEPRFHPTKKRSQ